MATCIAVELDKLPRDGAQLDAILKTYGVYVVADEPHDAPLYAVLEEIDGERYIAKVAGKYMITEVEAVREDDKGKWYVRICVRAWYEYIAEELAKSMPEC